MPFTLIAITNPDRGLRKAFLQTYPMNPKDALVVERIKKGFQLYGATLEAINPTWFLMSLLVTKSNIFRRKDIHKEGIGCSEVLPHPLKANFQRCL